MGGAYSKEDPPRVRVGSLQERRHSLLRPCHCPVLAGGRMLRAPLNLVKSRAIFIESSARIGSVTLRSSLHFSLLPGKPGRKETGSPMTASTANFRQPEMLVQRAVANPLQTFAFPFGQLPPCPLWIEKLTRRRRTRMSALCQEQKSAPRQSSNNRAEKLTDPGGECHRQRAPERHPGCGTQNVRSACFCPDSTQKSEKAQRRSGHDGDESICGRYDNHELRASPRLQKMLLPMSGRLAQGARW